MMCVRKGKQKNKYICTSSCAHLTLVQTIVLRARPFFYSPGLFLERPERQEARRDEGTGQERAEGPDTQRDLI